MIRHEGENWTLYVGDCRDVLPTLEAGSVGAVVTDPPYGIVNQFGTQQSGKGRRTLQFAWDSSEGIREGIREGVSLCRPSASGFVFTGFDTAEIGRDVFRSAGFTVKPAAWVKACPPPAMPGNWWPSAFELAMYAYRQSPPFCDDDARRNNVFIEDSYRHGQPGKVDHPTQKPLQFMLRIVRALSPVDGVTLDPFAGSGSTGVACVLEGRRFIGVEIDPAYAAIAVKRLQRAEADVKSRWPWAEAEKALEQRGMFT